MNTATLAQTYAMGPDQLDFRSSVHSSTLLPSQSTTPQLLSLNTDINATNRGCTLERTYAMGPDQLDFRSSVHSLTLPLSTTPQLATLDDLAYARVNPGSIENLLLSDLMKNKHVKDLYDNFIRTTKELTRTTEDLRDLRSKYDSLMSKHMNLWGDEKSKHSALIPDDVPSTSTLSLSPSDSASQQAATASVSSAGLGTLSETLTLVKQPIVRPDEYPQEVLWNLEDIKRCPFVKVSPQNISRPPVQSCLRTPTGSTVSDSQWADIRLSASRVTREVFQPLFGPDTALRKRYFKENHVGEWEEALAKIEAQQPLLRLCSLHWKAELVLAHALETISNQIASKAKAPKKKKPKRTAVPPPPSQATPPQPLILTASSLSPVAAALPPSPVTAASSPSPVTAASSPLPVTVASSPSFEAAASSPPFDASSPPFDASSPPFEAVASPPSETAVPSLPQSTASQAPLPSPSAAAPTGPPMSPLKFSKHRMELSSPAAQVKKRTKRNVRNAPAIVASSAGDAKTSKVDISGIAVRASYEALKDIVINDPNFQRVPHVLDLLEALHKIPETAEALPTPAIEDFLAAIEHADPNSSDVDEDNTNSSWGHCHFRSGTAQFSNLTWEQVANKQTAYRILAATIKTCRVARHLCFKRHITFNSVIADMYFATIVKDLWETIAKSPHAHTPPPPSLNKPGQNSRPGSNLSVISGIKEHSELQNLRVNQLKALVQRLNIITKSAKGWIVKNEVDYLMVLASIPIENINEHLSEIA